jgi:hypothetical protein
MLEYKVTTATGSLYGFVMDVQPMKGPRFASAG